MSINNHNKCVPLPPDLIVYEILPKLPVKSLIRFKSVSRSWFSNISSPEFAKIHLQSSSSRPQFIISRQKDLTKIWNVEVETLCLQYSELDCEIQGMGTLEWWFRSISPGPDRSSLLNSCNGLLCFYTNQSPGSFTVWNPATCKFRRIEFPHCAFQTSSHTCRFSYLSSKDEYRLFAGFRLKDNRLLVHDWYLFSLCTGEWKRYDGLSNRFPVRELQDVVLIDDTAYLLLSDRIVGLSLINEELKEFSLLNWPKAWRLMQLRGCLSLICYSNGYVWDVWVLKRPCEWNSWEKLFSHKCGFINGISGTGKWLVRHNWTGFKVVDPSALNKLSSKGIRIEGCMHIGSSIRRGFEDYVESLVSPF